MVTSTKPLIKKGTGLGNFPGPNGKKPGGNGWQGGDGSKRKFSPAKYRITMWVIIAAIVMMFAALSSSYIFLAGGESRQHVAMPPLFFLSTGIILVSSLTLERAKRSLKQEHSDRYVRWLSATLALGLSFLSSQLLGWRELAKQGAYFAGHPDSSFYYFFTAVHGIHLLGGIFLLLYLLVSAKRLSKETESEKHRTWASLVGLYWHTMDLLWLWLFGLLLIFQ
jgi:cytochrome c oxidase subunit III